MYMMSDFGNQNSAEVDKSMEVEEIIDTVVAAATQVPGDAAPAHVEEDIALVKGNQHLPSEDAEMAEKTSDKPETPAAPAAQQGEHEPSSEPTIVRRILNQVRHFYLRFARDSLTAVQQGNHVKAMVKDGIAGDNLSVLLAGQVAMKIFSGWADVSATMPGDDDGQVKGICTRLEECGVGLGASNGKIQDIGSGFIVHEGFNWTGGWRGGSSRTCRSAWLSSCAISRATRSPCTARARRRPARSSSARR